MKKLKYLALAGIAAICFTVAAPKIEAQISVNIGVAPECPYGYYDASPYGRSVRLLRSGVVHWLCVSLVRARWHGATASGARWIDSYRPRPRLSRRSAQRGEKAEPSEHGL